MDTAVKEQFDAFCRTVGMNTNTAINMFARTIIRNKRLPFDVRLDIEAPAGEAYATMLNESITQLDAGKGHVHELIEVGEYD
jgi:DNA-damage-inducible protein J